LPLLGRRRRFCWFLKRRRAHPGRRRGRRRLGQEAGAGGRDLLGHLGRWGRAVQRRHIGLEIPEHRLERAPPDVVLSHLRADGEPHALSPLRRYAEHVADLRQRAQRRRLHLRRRVATARGGGGDDELTREHVKVRGPSGGVRA